MSTVYKKGNHVYRTQKNGSAHIHRLLTHLEAKGISGVPRFVGVDDQGREILTYLEGETADYPLKAYMWSDEAIQDAARLMRQLHDATADVEWPSDWQPLDHTPEPFEVICHNDFAVYSMTGKWQESSTLIWRRPDHEPGISCMPFIRSFRSAGVIKPSRVKSFTMRRSAMMGRTNDESLSSWKPTAGKVRQRSC